MVDKKIVLKIVDQAVLGSIFSYGITVFWKS